MSKEQEFYQIIMSMTWGELESLSRELGYAIIEYAEEVPSVAFSNIPVTLATTLHSFVENRIEESQDE